MNFRDCLTILNMPKLRSIVHRARTVGLESLLDYQRLMILSSAAKYCATIEGDFLECGTYRGGSAAVIANQIVNTGKKLFVCDSFQGLPPSGPHDNIHKEGDFRDTQAQHVINGLKQLALPIEVKVGFFSDTFPELSECRFSFAHIDVDLFDSVEYCLNFCYPRMISGGIIILDDYGAPTCLGARTATNRFFANRIEKPIVLSEPAYGVCVGQQRAETLNRLCQEAGWLTRIPGVARLIYRKS